MAELIIAEEHDQVYQVWHERGARDIAITHLDFHCDMCGLMIDRPRGIAYMVSNKEKRFITKGNFLAHAIMNGIVSSVRWVHDPHGGRRFDVGTVKYEYDTTAFLHRLLHHLRGDREVNIDFQELHFSDWDGVRQGEQLDIDWDGIASAEYQLSHIQRLMNSFLDMKFSVIPETTFLVFSPFYSHPNRDLFETFAARLAEKFSATIVRLPKPMTKSKGKDKNLSLSRQVRSFLFRAIARTTPETLKVLRRQALDGIRAYQTRRDVNFRLRS